MKEEVIVGGSNAVDGGSGLSDKLKWFLASRRVLVAAVSFSCFGVTASSTQEEGTTATDKTMNWCGWRTNTTYSTSSATGRDFTTWHNWFDNGNALNTVNGYWWNEKNMTSSVGSWVDPGTYGKNILVQWNQGGRAYVDTCITNVAEIRLGISQTYPSVLRIDEGGSISNVNIMVGGARFRNGGSLTGRNARLHINGGDVTVGRNVVGDLSYTGLNIAYGAANDNAEGGVFMTDGNLVVDRRFSIASMAVGNTGYFALTNGNVRSRVTVYAGPFTTNSSASGTARIIQAGGKWIADANVSIRRNATYELDGGELDVPVLSVIRGGTVKMTGGKITGGMTLYWSGGDAGITNTFYLSGGTLCVTNTKVDSQSTSGWFASSDNARFVQTGGVHTNTHLWGGESGRSRYEISGGEFCATRTWLGGNYPFFFRIQGTPRVSTGAWASNGNASNPTNCLIEHVIADGSLAPIEVRRQEYNFAHGHQRIRPLGGVQIVATNFFPLFRFNRGGMASNRVLKKRTAGTNDGKLPMWGTWPDAALWTLDQFNTTLPAWRDVKTVSAAAAILNEADAGTYYDTGVTLSGAALKGVLSRNGKAVEFEAASMGYLVWPNAGTNGVKGVNVAMRIAAPHGGTLVSALGKVCDGLTEAGFADVTSDASAEYNVTFTVPIAKVPNRNPDGRLLFDFTETPVPAGGLTREYPMQHLPAVTNALVSGVACRYDGGPGFVIGIR